MKYFHVKLFIKGKVFVIHAFYCFSVYVIRNEDEGDRRAGRLEAKSEQLFVSEILQLTHNKGLF